jgi:hypothetical protein
MARRTSGGRFPLLLYSHAIGRYRAPAMLLAVLLLGLWYLVGGRQVAWPSPSTEPWLLAGGLTSLLFFLLVWVAPRFAYVQPRQDHLVVRTPIYRMKISYRRVVNTRPVDLARMFPPGSTRGSYRRLLRPFYGRTALGVDLRGLPMSKFTLRLFFHPLLLAADGAGLVLVVRDWMALSNQLSSLVDAWRSSQQVRPRGRGIGAAAILNEDDR